MTGWLLSGSGHEFRARPDTQRGRFDARQALPVREWLFRGGIEDLHSTRPRDRRGVAALAVQGQTDEVLSHIGGSRTGRSGELDSEHEHEPGLQMTVGMHGSRLDNG